MENFDVNLYGMHKVVHNCYFSKLLIDSLEIVKYVHLPVTPNISSEVDYFSLFNFHQEVFA